MHWVSIAALVSASLFPVASGSPCRPHSITASGISTTAVSVESSSTATVENPTTVTTTTAADVTTKTTEATTTTNAESTTTEELTSTTKAETTSTVEASTTADTETTSTAEAATTTTAETTTAEATSTTTSAAAGPTNAVQNGGFEDAVNTAWVLQGSTIANTGLAHTGTHFLEIDVTNNNAIGQNSATQVINGLDTTLLYQLAFYYTVFSNPTPVIIPGTICLIQVEQGGSVIGQPPVSFANLDSYQQFTVNFTPSSASTSLGLRLRCTNNRRVTLSLGIDDVSILPA